uniref:Uncharacterized protein n=1 Tax=uncultured Desulfobacterium sp. TaxID=201089 RepID=E1YBG0_9BACT|nr:unknown protein [uncultured Desulfobacterium sp.]
MEISETFHFFYGETIKNSSYLRRNMYDRYAWLSP